MRPDEHKKKKNREYKKKHPGKVEESSGKNKVTKVKTGVSGECESDSSASKQRERLSTCSDTTLSTQNRETHKVTHSDVDAYFEEVQPEFRRRDVKSNWDRYDDLPADTDDATTLRGADFQALLDATSHSVSQFQFEEEKEWAESDNVGDFDGWMSVDCKQLAACVLTIPLHERLGLDNKYFTDEQLNCFIGNAKLNEDIYQKKSGDETNSDRKQDTVIANNIVLSPSKESLENQTVDHETKDLLDDLLQSESEVSGSNLSQTVLNKEPILDRKSGSQKLVRTSSTEEVDLDDLLSGNNQFPADTVCKEVETIEKAERVDSADIVKCMDKKQKHSPSLSVKTAIVGEKQQHQNVNLEDELDDLLNLDCPASTAIAAPSHGLSEGGALDDWLDSVLED